MITDVAPQREAGKATPTTAKHVPFLAILPTARLPQRKCWWLHADLPRQQVWAIVIDGQLASREAIDNALLPEQPAEELVELLDRLNAEVTEPDQGELVIGLVDVTHPRVASQRSCAHSFYAFEEIGIPPLARGRYEPATGLRNGEVPKRLGAYSASVLAPKLAGFLSRKYGDTATPERLFTRAEHRSRIAAEDRDAAAAAYRAGVDQAAGELAQLLWGTIDVEACARAVQVVAAIENVRRAQAAR